MKMRTYLFDIEGEECRPIRECKYFRVSVLFIKNKVNKMSCVLGNSEDIYDYFPDALNVKMNKEEIGLTYTQSDSNKIVPCIMGGSAEYSIKSGITPSLISMVGKMGENQTSTAQMAKILGINYNRFSRMMQNSVLIDAYENGAEKAVLNRIKKESK